MRCAVTVSLVPEAASGPFVFHGDLDLACARAADLGFHAIELFPASGEALDARLLRQVLHRNRLELAAVGTGAGWLTRKLTLTSPDSAARRRAQQFIAALVDFAGGFGAPVILGSMQGRAEGEVSRGQALAWLAEAIEQLAPRAHACGARFYLEPLNRYESNLLNTVGDTLDFIRSLRTQNVRILADLFHMNIEEGSISSAIRAGGARIGHVHFADSNRRAVGLGHTQITEVVEALQAIGYNGYLSAEVLPLPSADEAARATMEAFRRYFPLS